jgi:hypothetical protein
VNTYTTGYQFTPALAVQPGGDFIVAWSGQGPDGINGGDVFARRYDAGGNPLGPQFRVNSYTTYSQALPAIAAGPSGDFVVVWEGGFNYEVYGQRFDAAGNPRGNEFLVNTYTTSRQSRPDVAADSAGGFVVTWTSYQGGGYTNVFGQRYDGNGSRRGAEFRVNTYTTGTQYQYGVASDPAGNFTVVWRSVSDQDGDGHSIHAQRFGGLQPAALAVDEPGNDVWEPGELAEVKPAWHNIHGAAQSFGGVLSNITGPAGATYGVADNSASYGSVPDGATASCTDCYVVLVNNPSSRPAAHWDATALETITPDAQGQVRRHTLHIGASFADISSGPFYRFVETLLHNGITSGCGDGNYCPGSATTRAQMSVFVLLAREGAGYAPPACTTPVFTDVPASNPFCRFIEELARRNVVSGCGPSLYCPDNPVTREQMSVFVLRTLDPVLDPPACVAGSELFADVPASSPFCRWIEELARRQVVSGCGDDNYCPTAPVTREQMGVFITVTFGLTLY